MIHAGPVWGPRLQTTLIVSLTAVVAVFVGKEVGEAGADDLSMPVIGLAALAGGIVLFSIPPEKLFLGWLFMAPLLQNSADTTAAGRALVFACYLAPAAVLVTSTVLGWRSDRPFRPIDAFPGLFVVFVFGSLVFTTSLLTDDPFGASKAFFATSVIGPIVYYVVVFGPGSRIRPSSLVRVLLLASLLQSVLALFEWRTGWNVWGDTSLQLGGSDLSRTISTLDNPAVLGVVIGAGIVLALALLSWDGPRELRRLAWLVVLLGTPAILVTLTRAPVVATALASAAVVLGGRRGRAAALFAVAVAAVALFAAWPSLTATEVYQERVANEETVEARSEIQRASLRLAAMRPVAGHGYGSFDEVKNTVGRTMGVSASVLYNTSHNSYLTVLVEYGAIGLSLLVLPWLVVVSRAFPLIRRSSANAWFVVGSVAATLIYCLSALSTDFRFFSLAQALPWLFVGFIRSSLDEGGR